MATASPAVLTTGGVLATGQCSRRQTQRHRLLQVTIAFLRLTRPEQELGDARRSESQSLPQMMPLRLVCAARGRTLLSRSIIRFAAQSCKQLNNERSRRALASDDHGPFLAR